MKPLANRIAVVCGATRGVGRGIACMLGEAGATVYCTGRSVAGRPPTSGAYAGRPETIEETAAQVTAHGGAGSPSASTMTMRPRLRLSLIASAREQGHVDMLVLDFWGDDTPVPFGTPFWSIPIDAGRRTIERTLWPHVLTLQALTPLLMIRPAAAVSRHEWWCSLPTARACTTARASSTISPPRCGSVSPMRRPRSSPRMASRCSRCRPAMSGPSSRSSVSA